MADDTNNDYGDSDFSIGGYSAGRVAGGSDGAIVDSDTGFEDYAFISRGVDGLVVPFQGTLRISPLYAAGSPATGDTPGPEGM